MMAHQSSMPFGLWKSSISAAMLSQQLSLKDVLWNQDGTLVWSEGRSASTVLVAQAPDDAPRDLTT
ncbi:MAG: hypothetical protein JW750_04695, partial [Anaerolineaceae bacterium]|nr:hypothetical protein [Anaerolineaceae bacterium]